MSGISITYTPKYQISFATEYKFTKCGLCVNTKTGRKIKKVYNNGSIGYSIRGKFRSLTFLRRHLEKVNRVECPF